MSRKLNKALREQKHATQQVPQEIYGTLMSINGTVETIDRPSFVNVQLRDNQNEIIQAFNNKVAASPDLPVIVHREGNRYVIQGVNTQRYQNIWNNYAPYLPKHGTAHSFADGGGGDVSWIFSRQFMPNLVYPNGGGVTGSSAYIAPHVLLLNNETWAYTGATGTPDLIQYKGTGSSSAMILVYLDANTGNPGILVGSGSYFPNALTGTATVFPYIPVPNRATQIPLAAVRMDTGTAGITWDNLYDVRQWIHALPSGTSSGGGGGGGIDTIGFAGLANGVPIGTGTILNVIGAGATFTRSGTVFNLDIPGGGGTAPVTGSMVIQNNGLNLGSATILNFTNGITASISGSVAQISVTGSQSTYVRTAPPISLSSHTGTYWRTQEGIFASGSLAIFNQGHALIPSIDYVEQYPVSGTFQYITHPSTGTYSLAIYGIPVESTIGSGGGGASGGGVLVQRVGNTLGASSGTSTALPYDDSIPQSGEGAQFLSQTITPTDAGNDIYIDVTVFGSVDGADYMCIALFQNGVTDALAAVAGFVDAATASLTLRLQHKMTAGTTSPITFTVNAGKGGAGTFRINGRTSTGRIFGGVASSSITIDEITP